MSRKLQRKNPKLPRPLSRPEKLPAEDSFITWTFRNVDNDGKFAFNPNRNDFNAKDFVEKMLAYSNMTQHEIKNQTHDADKSKHHYLENLDCLSTEARQRIKAKQFEDKTDKLFSLALNNKTRIIGFLDGAEFQVVWYDANHEFCPSPKKHT